MIMKGDRPCKVIDIKVSKTGKHGHAKCRFTAIDIFDGSKHEDIVPSTHGAMVPVVTRVEYQVIGLEDGYLQLMTDDGEMKEDLQPPSYPEGLGADLEAAIEAAEAEGLTVVVSVRITGRILHHPKSKLLKSGLCAGCGGDGEGGCGVVQEVRVFLLTLFCSVLSTLLTFAFFLAGSKSKRIKVALSRMNHALNSFFSVAH